MLIVGVLVVVGGCSPKKPLEPTASGPADAAQSETGADQAGPAMEDAPAALGGTTWRLVKIMSMDDTTSTPEDPDSYTLQFGEDGSMSLRADCNRGTGSWTSTATGKLEFGVIAATQAMCPPGSLHDVYLAQFPWVRSYVIENGHLFLATMADGSIIEFEPAPATP